MQAPRSSTPLNGQSVKRGRLHALRPWKLAALTPFFPPVVGQHSRGTICKFNPIASAHLRRFLRMSDAHFLTPLGKGLEPRILRVNGVPHEAVGCPPSVHQQ